MPPLLIVESPTKAKTIKKFLGNAYNVVSSFGHIRDLPPSEMGVDVKHNFKPTYVVPDEKKDKVADLKKAAKASSEVYLATDEDREGEAIAWHVAEVLGLDPDTAKRITFHEITKHAIDAALSHPRHIEMPLVHAQQARRILDRLVGYELSPLLWKKVRRGLSAGRVQSVAVRLVVERERERLAFKNEEFWTIDAMMEKAGMAFEAKLHMRDGKKLDKFDVNTSELAQKIVDDLTGATFAVGAIEKKKVSRKPPTPLTTSALQQEANNRLGMSAKQAMAVAQKLYETGRITYMRTDSMNLAEKFLGECQTFINTSFGNDFAKGAVTYTTKSKGAQEAHEAIRPTDVNFTPDLGKTELEPDQAKLYDLIWRRTVAGQMPHAVIERSAVDLNAKNYGFRATGSAIDFEGFLKVYRNAQEKFLPDLKVGDSVNTTSITPNQHFTEPQPRYSDATLIKALEEHGIGRPSTYAPTISTIVDRGYVERDDNKKLFPTEIAMIVNDVLVEHFPNIVDLEFTAKMEADLDGVAEGKTDWVPTLKAFYEPFHETLVEKGKSLSRDEIMKPRELGIDPKTGLKVVVRTGRFGPFVQLGDKDDAATIEKIGKPKNASIPKDTTFDTVTLEQALPLLRFPRELGNSPEGESVTVNLGPYGPYIKIGKGNASLPPEVDPVTLTLEAALSTFATVKAAKAEATKPLAILGPDPESGGTIEVRTGRYGPYVTDGKTNASINKKIDPATVTLEIAIEILRKKRLAPKRNWKRKAKKNEAT